MNWVIPLNIMLMRLVRQAGQITVSILLSFEVYGIVHHNSHLVDITAVMALTILGGLYIIESLRW